MKSSYLLILFISLNFISIAQHKIELLVQTGHSNSVGNIRFSPNDQYFASSSNDKTIKLFSKDGILLHTFNEFENGTLQFEFTSDSKYLILYGLIDSLYIIDCALKKVTKQASVQELQGDRFLIKNAYSSADGKSVIVFYTSSHTSNEYLIAKVPLDGKKVSVLSKRSYEGDTYSIEMNKTKDRILHLFYHDKNNDSDFSMYLRDTANAKLIKAFKKVTPVSFSPDGSRIVFCEKENEKAVFKICSSKDGSLLKTIVPDYTFEPQTFRGIEYFVDRIELSARNQFIIVKLRRGNYQSDVFMIFNLEGTLLQTINEKGNEAADNFAMNNAENRFLFVKGGGGDNSPLNMEFYRFENGQTKLLNSISDNSKIFSLAFGKANRSIIVGRKSDTRIWDINGSVIGSVDGTSYANISVSNDSTSFFVTGRSEKITQCDSLGNILSEYPVDDYFFEAYTYLSPDGTKLLFVGSNAVQIVSLQTKKVLKTIDYKAIKEKNSGGGPEGAVWVKSGIMVFCNRQVDLYDHSGNLVSTKSYPCCKIEEGNIGYSTRLNQVLVTSFGGTVYYFNTEGTIVKEVNMDWQVTFGKYNTEYPTKFTLSDRGNVFAVGSNRGNIYLYSIEGTFLKKLSSHHSFITAMAFSSDGKFFVSGSRDSEMILWDIKKNYEPIANYYTFGEKDFAVVTPDGYYTASKQSLDKIYFGKGNKTYHFENFDLQYNRPDIIMERIGLAPKEVIELYKQAHKKRLKRVNISELNFLQERSLHLPEVSITSHKEYFMKSDLKTFSFSLTAKDSLYKLHRLFIWVNGVPLYGMGGVDWSAQNKNTIPYNCSFELSKGTNLVEVAVLNEKGVESLKETFEVEYSGKTTSDLYIITIGVSQFQDGKMNLTYAAKDSKDIVELFSNTEDKIFRKTITLPFLNKDATKTKILTLKETLKQTKVDDVVMVFISSHGILDEEMNYYIATYDINFQKPAEKGLSYEELETLLSDISARRKTIFMDACHSGEIDKDEVKVSGSTSIEENDGELKFRAFGNTVVSKNGGMKNTLELSKNLFSDLRKNSGTNIISSAGGMEYAIEGGQWKNGVFTYCMLNGLKEKEADLDKDGMVMLSELTKYMQHKVPELTNGRQQPTSRVENVKGDYRIK